MCPLSIATIRATLAAGGLQTPERRRSSVLDSSWTARAERVIELAEGGSPAGPVAPVRDSVRVEVPNAGRATREPINDGARPIWP